jgi:hypothetical protein
MCIEQWWNDTDSGKLKYWEKKSIGSRFWNECGAIVE